MTRKIAEDKLFVGTKDRAVGWHMVERWTTAGIERDYGIESIARGITTDDEIESIARGRAAIETLSAELHTGDSEQSRSR